jgi:hypothetical protein
MGYKEEEAKVNALPKALQDEVNSIACRLSPENLACDGECSRTETRRRYSKCLSDWKKLCKLYPEIKDIDIHSLY